jgi:hypothetical protein
MLQKKVFLEQVRPEVRLLLECARTRVEPDAAQSIGLLLRENIDWGLLLRTAWQHGVTPLLYRSVESVDAKAVPSSVLDDIRSQVRAITARTALQVTELLRLLALFEAAGIRAIPFKGPVLSAAAYGSIALRMSSDLDILVARDQVPTVCEILVEQGYACPQEDLSPDKKDAFRFVFNQHCFHCRRNSIVVEPHWELMNRAYVPPLDTTQLRARAVTASLAGRPVPGLTPEDSMTFLCAHGYVHLWARLAWICDVAELMRAHPGMNLQAMIVQATSVGGRRSLLLGLHLAHELLDMALPRDVLRMIESDRKVGMLASKVAGRLFQDRSSMNYGLTMVVFHLQAKERVRDQLVYLLRLATTPTFPEFKALPLARGLFFLYPPILLVWRLIKHPPRLLRGLAHFRSAHSDR